MSITIELRNSKTPKFHFKPEITHLSNIIIYNIPLTVSYKTDHIIFGIVLITMITQSKKKYAVNKTKTKRPNNKHRYKVIRKFEI